MLNINLSEKGVAVITDLDQRLPDEGIGCNKYMITDGVIILKEDDKPVYIIPLTNVNRILISE